MNLFIDTNVFLSFYHYTKEDLEELKKLAVLIDQRRLVLYLTDQVVDEFLRNRESKIADALKKLREQRLKLEFPQLCKDYDAYHELREHQKNYEEKHAELLEKIEKDVENRALKADGVIQTLFEKATVIEACNGPVEKARKRIEIGNPPGKSGSLGDAISWEALLAQTPHGEDIYFITDDNDYFSALDQGKFKEFLLREWLGSKGSNLHCYRRLSAFFKDHYPEIQLASELEKELLIGQLSASSSFQETHRVIAKLSQYRDFNTTQVNQIIEAAVFNPQVRWIVEDPDVKRFLQDVIEGHEDELSDDLKTVIEGREDEIIDHHLEKLAGVLKKR